MIKEVRRQTPSGSLSVLVTGLDHFWVWLRTGLAAAVDSFLRLAEAPAVAPAGVGGVEVAVWV